jgi:AraC-like DNA-binding protein
MNTYFAFPKHPALRGFVRGYMLAEGAAETTILAVSDATGLIFPLFGRASWQSVVDATTDTATGLEAATGTIQELGETPIICGPFDHPVRGKLHDHNATNRIKYTNAVGAMNDWCVSFSIVFEPTVLYQFMHKDFKGLHEVQNQILVVENCFHGSELLQEKLRELYSQAVYDAAQAGRAFNPATLIPILLPPAEQFMYRQLSLLRSLPLPTHEWRKQQRAKYITRQLTGTHGNLSIKALALDMGLSERQVLNIVQTTTGVSGKNFGMIQRFIYASQLLRQAAHRAAFGDITSYNSSRRHANIPKEEMFARQVHSAIHTAGYYDQSHCIRAFKRFAGMTPMEFLQKEHALFESFTATRLHETA